MEKRKKGLSFIALSLLSSLLLITFGICCLKEKIDIQICSPRAAALLLMAVCSVPIVSFFFLRAGLDKLGCLEQWKMVALKVLRKMPICRHG
jgi:hypothetical protein